MADSLEPSSQRNATIHPLHAPQHLRPAASHPQRSSQLAIGKTAALSVQRRIAERVLIPVKSGPRGVVLLIPLERIRKFEDQLSEQSRLLLRKIYLALEINSIIREVEIEQKLSSRSNSGLPTLKRNSSSIASWKQLSRSEKNLDPWLEEASSSANNDAWRFNPMRRRSSLRR